MPHSCRNDLLALIVLACAAPSVSAEEAPLDAGAVRAAVLAETNAYRASKNIPELQENAALQAAATAYAVYLAEHEKMGHTADGSNPPKRVSAQGYKYCFISENVWSSFRHSQTMNRTACRRLTKRNFRPCERAHQHRTAYAPRAGPLHYGKGLCPPLFRKGGRPGIEAAIPAAP